MLNRYIVIDDLTGDIIKDKDGKSLLFFSDVSAENEGRKRNLEEFYVCKIEKVITK